MIFVLLLEASMALMTGLILAAMTQTNVSARDLRRQAEEKGLSLLRSWLTPEQDEQWGRSNTFEVVGCDTGTRYRVTTAAAMNVIELDKDGHFVRRWCFTPKGPIVPGDMLLAQKIALETMEAHALSVANSQRP
jgi:hypothetical protein